MSYEMNLEEYIVYLSISCAIFNVFDSSKTVKFFPKQISWAPTAQLSDPDFRGCIDLSVANFALELANVLARQFNFGSVGHI